MTEKKRERLIFWDWTGTLADEARVDRAICEEMERAIARRRLVPLNQARRLFQEYLKKLENRWEWHDYVRHSKAFKIPWKKIQEGHLDVLHLLPGALDLLTFARERGYRNLLATNAVRPVIELRLQHLGIGGIFDAIITSDDVEALKAEGLHFRRGLELFGARPADCFSIGDNPVQDISSARSLGLRTIYCAFGRHLTHYHTSHLAANHSEAVLADYTVRSLSEIKDILSRETAWLADRQEG